MLQHGWRHDNHAFAGKKSEFPAGRNPSKVSADLAAGAARLRALFGSRFVPILAPPWNRFAAEFLPLLAPAGIAGLSVMAAGRPSELPGGVVRDGAFKAQTHRLQQAHGPTRRPGVRHAQGGRVAAARQCLAWRRSL